VTQAALAYAAGTSSVATDSTTWYGPWGTQGALTQLETTEAPTQAIVRGAFTLKNFYARPHTNTRSTNSSVLIRKNGATSVTMTLPNGSTSPVVDTSSTVSYADGDTWNYAIVTSTGGGNLGVNVSAQIETSAQSFNTLAAFGSVSSTTSARYYCLGGTIAATNVEANANAKALEGASTLSNLQIYVRTNPSAAGFDVRSRVNGANGNQLIAAATIGTATGWFEDTTNTDSPSIGDLFCVTTSAPSSAITIGYLGMKLKGGSAGTSMMSGLISGTALAAGATRYSPFTSSFGATEGQNNISAPYDCNMSKLTAYVQANSSTTDVTLVSRVAAADGSNTLTLTALTAPAYYQDTTHTTAITAAQSIGIKASGGTTASVTIGWIGCLLTDPNAGGGVSGGMLTMGAG